MIKNNILRTIFFRALGFGLTGSFIYKVLSSNFDALITYDFISLMVGVGALIAGFTYPLKRKRILFLEKDEQSLQDSSTR